MPRTLEAELEKACTDLLELDGWRTLKTDPVSDKARGKGFGEKGMADYLYIRYGQFYANYRDRSAAEVMWIEWKIPKGTVAEKQHAWREKERARGALALIAGVDFHASIDGFARWYQSSGLQRRKFKISGDSYERLK